MSRPSFYTMAGFQAGIAGVAAILLQVLPQGASEFGKMGSLAWLWGLMAALLSYTLLAGVNRYSNLMQRHTFATLQRVRPLFTRLTLWQMVVISALAGIGEELLFRAFLQNLISGHSNIWLGLGLSSLIFALLHFLSWFYFCITLLMGLLLGAGYYLSNSILFVIVWHGVYDLIALWVLVHAPQWLGLPRASVLKL
ncbi:CPBP family intramembrane glutamic endopeptidase [Gilvimarinus agarilyticus]|uniref:CPBP family intramembrane glutamic endopeptidase n=1 Tax=Gilvimarinus agarilyticus TaxID=679259 RepID=UPI000697D918|nr:CPBP family intramembrane glutamic endopeptidase [Gilvimarinus agarilyticus]